MAETTYRNPPCYVSLNNDKRVNLGLSALRTTRYRDSVFKTLRLTPVNYRRGRPHDCIKTVTRTQTHAACKS